MVGYQELRLQYSLMGMRRAREGLALRNERDERSGCEERAVRVVKVSELERL